MNMDPEKNVENEDQNTGAAAPDSTNSITNEEPQSNEAFLTGFKLYGTLFSVMIVGFIITLDASIVVTAIPRITAEFNSIDDIGWYGSAYSISNCVCQLNSGKIYQQHSLKITFLVFLSIFEIGSLICGVATSSMMLIIGRSIAGIGGSGLMNGAFTIVGTVSPTGKRPLYLGIVMGFILLGIVAGPLLGGVLTEEASWRWCFYINLPIGGVSALVVLFTKLPDRTSSKARLSFWKTFKRLDPVGFVTFAPFCIMLLLALQWGGTSYPWKSSTIIGLLCGSVATLFVFIAWEYRCGDKAMMPISLLSKRIVYSSCITSIFQMGGVQLVAFFLPLWFQVIKNASPTMSGVYLLGTIGPQIIFAVLSGGLISRLGYYTPWSIGGNALSAIGCGLISTLTITSSARKYIGYQFIYGIGRGVTMQQPVTAVQTAVSASQLSIGTAFIVFTQFLGGGIFIALGQTTFTNSLGPALERFAPGVDAKFLINVGATNLRKVVAADELSGVLKAYNQALMNIFYLAAGACVAAFISSWGMGWVNVKKVKRVESNV